MAAEADSTSSAPTVTRLTPALAAISPPPSAIPMGSPSTNGPTVTVCVASTPMLATSASLVPIVVPEPTRAWVVPSTSSTE